ncbi:MAG TPA: hypothetical protein PK079_26415 [Leptospiraceae bacterium]|nr:hypothetical protein [Leptospiraceae bacterium]
MPFGGYLNDPSEDYTYKDLGLKLSRGKDPLEPNHIEREWGCLIHPDEMRQILFIGNGRLITSGGDQITDNQLKNWVDQSVRALSDLLKWDIYPRLWRHRPFHEQERIIEPYAEWEDMYDYHYKHSDLFFVSLRRKPVCKIINWRLASPYNKQTMIDLMPRMIPNYGAGILKSAVYIGAGFNMTVSQYRSTILRQDLPSSYQVDYVSGYDHADRVPRDLREIVQKLMVINVMSAFGDGVVSGMSNYSISLGPLSESIGTTMSATSAYFGARIAQMSGEIKDWLKTRGKAYTGIGFRGL